ncbi:MAG: 4-hydroxybenzoyl-CoA reductase subunit beta [Pseudorhodoplanes sp.]
MTEPLPDFRVTRPRDVPAALAARRDLPNSRYLAGGTDLIVNLRRGLHKPEHLIDLSGIAELSTVSSESAGLRIGAGVTIAALARHPLLAGRYRALAQAAAGIAAPGHRTLGTVGGNLCLDTRCIYYNQSEWWRKANDYCLKRDGVICHVAPEGRRCHAAFTGDLAPAMLVLGAEAEIAGTQGRRRIPLGALYQEDGRAHLTLDADEILVAVHLPANPPPSSYDKLRLRGAIDYPLAGVAVSLDAADGVVRELRVAVTGTNSRPFLLAGTDALRGRAIDDKLAQEMERLLLSQVKPMRTTVASAHYRRLAAGAIARRLLAALAAGGPL